MSFRSADKTTKSCSIGRSDRTCFHKPFPILLCPAHHAALPVRNRFRFQHTRRRVHKRDVPRYTCCAHAPQQVTDSSPDPSLRAVELVSSLRQELESLKRLQLSAACSLSIYRLTVLCTTQHRAEVVAALAQDNKQYSDDSLFFYLVRILGHSEDTSTQGLAADLLEALMQDLPRRLVKGLHVIPEEWETLAQLKEPLNIGGLLQLIIATASIKVKTAAVLLLILAGSVTEGMSKLVASGAPIVVLHEMLITANSHSYKSGAQQSAADEGALLSLSDVATNPKDSSVWAQEMAAVLPFIAASHALRQSMEEWLHYKDVGMHNQLLVRQLLLIMSTSISASEWTPAPHDTLEQPGNPVAQAGNWLRTRLAKAQQLVSQVPFMWQCVLFRRAMDGEQADVDIDYLDEMAQAQRDLRKSAHAILQSTQGTFADSLMWWTHVGPVLGAQQSELDTQVRILMPIMLVMLQSPSDQTRVYAARALSMLPPEAYTAVTTAILTSPVDVLGHLLTQLSGDAPSTNRSWYAALMGQCTPRFDPPELKKISDAGAVPYLLKLLQEANGQKSKIRTLRCLSNLANVSTEMATSIGVHGGAQQLLDILQAGFRQGRDGRLQLSEQSTDLTWVSLRTIYAMSAAARGSEANLLRADLPALLTKIIQCPACWKLEAGVADQAVACLHAFIMSPAGKQQVLQQLTPAVIDALMAVALRWLQDPGLEYGHYAVAADLLELTVELPAGRHKLAQPPVCTQLAKVLTASLDTGAQALILPLCELISHLHQDGSYASSPWLLNHPSSASSDQPAGSLPTISAAVATPDVQAQQGIQQTSAQQTSAQTPSQTSQQLFSQPKSETPTDTLAQAVQQTDAAEGRQKAHTSKPSQKAVHSSTSQDSPWSDAGEAAQSAALPAEILGCTGEAWHNEVMTAAIKLVALSETAATRRQAMMWLADQVLQLTDQACMDLSNSGAVQASIKLVQRESEDVRAQEAALIFCMRLQFRGLLPVVMLLDANLHQQLAALVIQSDVASVRAHAGLLLRAMWQLQPPLVSEFVSHKLLGPLLKLAADMSLHTADRLIYTTLVHQVWTYTASLVSEPLLVQAIPAVIHACAGRYPQAQVPLDAEIRQTLITLQQEALALLCSMADFSFYRPAIRKAEPADMVAHMLQAGCSQNDGQQQQESAQLALTLVHKLLKGQMDGSDGPDAPYNGSFYSAVTSNAQSVHCIIRMCRQGSIESRHGALAVLQQILKCAAGQSQKTNPVQTTMISLGVMPMLFEVVKAPDSTAEMRRMAEVCLASVHSDNNYVMAAFGTHCLIARLLAISLSECRAAANSDRRSM